MNIYDYQRPVGRIDDIPDLRNKLIAVYETKDKKELARFGLALGRHMLEVTGYEPCDEISRGFIAMGEWLDGKVNYHKARNIGGELHDLAREEKDPIKARFFRTMAQIICVPHVKYHALWATDFAVTLINRLYPGDIEAVKKEREFQMEQMKSI